MKRTLLMLPAAALLIVVVPSTAGALEAVWATNGAVGVSEVAYRLQLACPAVSLVCSLVDGYDETATSTMSGSGTLLVDSIGGTFQVNADSSQDVGSGAQPAYLTISGTDLTYPNIPFAGVPEFVNLLVFGLTNPVVGPTALDFSVAADYPFSETISYAGSAGVVGDLEFILPGIAVPPADILVSGVFRVLGDVDSDGAIDFELRDVTGTFSLQTGATISGEPVTVDVTADMTLNLRGELAGGGATVLPATDIWGLGVLVALLAASGRAIRRGRWGQEAR
jgi:hypothetical protein